MTAFEDIFRAIRRIFTWWVIIAPWERALRVRLGRHVILLEPGIHLSVPGLDKVYKQPIRMRTVDIGVQTITTSDGHAATIAGNVQYKIGDIERFYNSVHEPAATTIDLAAACIAKFITTHPKTECRPAAVETYVNEALDLSEFGFEAGRVNITDFAFVRTYRLISDDRAYREGSYFNMNEERVS